MSIWDDVEFDDGLAEAAIAACHETATACDGVATGLSGLRGDVTADWEGRARSSFDAAEPGVGQGVVSSAQACRDLARAIAAAADAARAEQARRERTRDEIREREEREREAERRRDAQRVPE